MQRMLLDFNVWLAMALDGQVHHSIAREWFDRVRNEDERLFCRLTQQGFLRLATNPKVFSNNALTMAERGLRSIN